MVWTISIAMADELKRKSVTYFYVADGYTETQVEEAAQALAGLVDNLISGVITSISVSRSVALPSGIKRAAAEPHSRVERGAHFAWRTALNHVASNRLPTFADRFMVRTIVDKTDDDVARFIDAITVGLKVSGGVVTFTDARGEAIASLDKAKSQHVRQRH